MLHANLKAVCSPQIASKGGGAGDTGVHVCAHYQMACWRNFWVCLIIRYNGLNVPCQQCVLVFVSNRYDLWHKTVLWGTETHVLCFPSDNGWGSLTYVQWSKSLNMKNANNRKTASCHKRGLILHIGSLSQNYLTSDIDKADFGKIQ